MYHRQADDTTLVLAHQKKQQHAYQRFTQILLLLLAIGMGSIGSFSFARQVSYLLAAGDQQTSAPVKSSATACHTTKVAVMPTTEDKTQRHSLSSERNHCKIN